MGRYVLFGELAVGGMATVHIGRLAGPVGFSRTVAIKSLHPHFAKDPEFVSMFLDEARLCARIRHPNVVSTLDVVTVGAEIFIIMEYVAGESLARLTKLAATKGTSTPPRIAATILSSVLHGLHAAHQAKDEHGRELGIVHRDVSPQNVLVGTDGIARVLDFGVAKAKGRVQTTRDGQVKGKIAYMPPEQISGGIVSRQTDIYAASVVLWETLTGRRLFDGETEAITLARAIEGRVEPPSQLIAGIDASLDAIVLRGLARDPAERFATAREMAVALEQSVGLASPADVGEWVDLVAKESLEQRASTIRAIEASALPANGPSSVDTAAPLAFEGAARGAPAAPESARVVGPAEASPSSRGWRGWFMGAAAALAIVGMGLAAAALRPGAGRETPNVLARDTVKLELRGAELASSKLSKSTPTPPPPAPPALAPPALAPPRPVTTPRAQTSQTSQTRQSKTPPSCDPPYVLDGSGIRKYKRECL